MPDYRIVLAVAALVLLCGCASQAKHQQTDFGELKLALPGVYGNEAQSAGGPAALAVTLSITLVGAQLIGDAVYFVRETAADNPRLVLSQGIWSLALDPHAGIVQQSFLFKEPRRWVGAADNPDLLVSLLPADLRALAGCELAWQKTTTGWQTTGAPIPQPRHTGKSAQGAHASAASAKPQPQPQSCRPGREAQGLWIEQRASLSGRELTLAQRRTSADGELESSEAPVSLVLTRAAAPTSTGP